MWVDTTITYIFDLNNGDIYVYFFHQFGDVGRVTEVRRYVDGSNDEILMDGIQYNTEGGEKPLEEDPACLKRTSE